MPGKVAHSIIRQRDALTYGMFWFFSRKTPSYIKWSNRRTAISKLPEGYDVDTHFKPRYNPWDQRPCLIPDGDLYVAIGNGRAEGSPTTSTTSIPPESL